jgi:DNA primase
MPEVSYSAGDDAKEQVRARMGIADLVERYVKLKPAGRNLKGLCPFHKEKTPSFIVTPDRGTFHCFGCGKGGDIFAFLQEIEAVDFREALQMLAEETGVQLASASRPPYETEQPQNGPSKSEAYRIHQIAMRYYYECIRGNEAAVKYFKSRGLRAETVREFMLGYAPAGWNNLTGFMSSKGVDPAALVGCGLALQKEGGRPYDRFRERVMFTLFDAGGRPIAFAGRGLEPDSQPKYLNSPETNIYRKSRTLYGLHKALPFIKERNQVLVVEGYMDFLSLYEAGVRHAVATSGTALTAEHAQMMRRYVSQAVLVFDGDSAGVQAALRGVAVLMPANLDVRVILLPEGQDPDSYIRSAGNTAFEDLVNRAQDGFSFVLENAVSANGVDTAHAKSAVLDAIVPLIDSTRDNVVRADCVKRTAERIGVGEPLVVQRLAPNGRRQSSAPSAPSVPEQPYASRLEGHFIHLLISHPELIPEAAEYIRPETLTDNFDNQLYSMILGVYEHDSTLEGLLNATEDSEMKRVISSLLAVQEPSPQPDEELAHVIIELQKKFVRYRLRQITRALRTDPHNAELLQQQKEFSLKLKELTTG